MFSVKLSLISIFFLLYITQLTSAAFLRCYKGIIDEYQVTPLEEPMAIASCINNTLPTVIYTFGYRGKPHGPATTAVLTAYIKKKKRNVLLLDWEYEAKSGVLGVAFGYAFSAVPSAKTVGRLLGDAIIKLSNSKTVNLADIHLVGHSLGAHIMGFAGKRVRFHGKVITRITGLDPARTLFEGTLAVHTGLDRTCAKFVDIVHTDPGGYGISLSSGTVDIWPNYYKNGGPQPGCPVGDFEMFTQEDLCNHDRSWRYFVEALASPTAFPCAIAKNYDAWASNQPIEKKIFLGDLTNILAKGNCYFNTNSHPPFARGLYGIIPDTEQNRGRRNPSIVQLLRYLR